MSRSVSSSICTNDNGSLVEDVLPEELEEVLEEDAEDESVSEELVKDVPSSFVSLMRGFWESS